jgi:hypothetical protein
LRSKTLLTGERTEEACDINWLQQFHCIMDATLPDSAY